MNPGTEGPSGPANAVVVWHEVECGRYDGDLELWRRLAGGAGGPILDLGCGTGRVALDLAGQGHTVRGLDLDAELVGAFNERATGAGLAAEAVAGDARDFALAERFDLILAPMQLIQVLADGDERLSFLRCAGRHLAPGGKLAVAIVDEIPPELVEEAPPPLPDTFELDGWVYSSLPLDAAVDAGAIVVRRLRQTVSPAGDLHDELDEIPLRLLSIETVEEEAREAGLEPSGRLEVPPTDSHIGSVVSLLEAR